METPYFRRSVKISVYFKFKVIYNIIVNKIYSPQEGRKKLITAYCLYGNNEESRWLIAVYGTLSQVKKHYDLLQKDLGNPSIWDISGRVATRYSVDKGQQYISFKGYIWFNKIIVPKEEPVITETEKTEP